MDTQMLPVRRRSAAKIVANEVQLSPVASRPAFSPPRSAITPPRPDQKSWFSRQWRTGLLVALMLVGLGSGYGFYNVYGLGNGQDAADQSAAASKSSKQAVLGAHKAKKNPAASVSTKPVIKPAPAPAPVSPAAPAIAPSAHCTYPSQMLNLTNWKETLPIGSASSPTEVKQPQLATFSLDPFFKVNAACTGVVFRAPTNGVTTSGSTYPRSELREMTANGTANASWSSTAGTHTMTIDQAITSLPIGKRHVVAGQIHDASNDIVVIRLESSKLFIDYGGKDGPTLAANYVLGNRFTIKFVVTGGTMQTYYNGALADSRPLNTAGLYFKAGAYTQSNCTTEAQRGVTCGPDDFGEVTIYGLSVQHQ